MQQASTAAQHARLALSLSWTQARPSVSTALQLNSPDCSRWLDVVDCSSAASMAYRERMHARAQAILQEAKRPGLHARLRTTPARLTLLKRGRVRV